MARNGPKGRGPQKRQAFLLPTFLPLEQVDLQDIKRWQAGQQKLLDFHWQWYIEIGRQRTKVIDEIHRTLQAVSIPFTFSGWRRSVRYKWSLSPLSSKGSLGVPGGRFNIGDIDETLFQKFPALYLAEDVDTALCEMLGPRRNAFERLDEFDLALVEEKSLTIIAAYGELESIIDLNNPNCLNKFVELIKSFQVSETLQTMAKEVNIDIGAGAVKTVTDLMTTLMNPNWRQFPMHVDLPANSQIFGQLVRGAGIEGILYPSKHTNRDCLGIFPENLKGGDSFVEIMDKEVPQGVSPKRLDSKTWNLMV
jgi:RES domain-containing protein